MASMDVGMGGRVAEELFFGNSEITTGCGSDLQSTTSSAYRMALFYAMSESLISISDLRSISNELRTEVEKSVQETLRVS
jgi:ATP-dependent metalloprotease